MVSRSITKLEHRSIELGDHTHLEDDADIGKQAEVVLLDASGQVIHALPTTLGNLNP